MESFRDQVEASGWSGYALTDLAPLSSLTAFVSLLIMGCDQQQNDSMKGRGSQLSPQESLMIGEMQG